MFSIDKYNWYIIRYWNDILYSENNKEILAERGQENDSTLAELSKKMINITFEKMWK